MRNGVFDISLAFFFLYVGTERNWSREIFEMWTIASDFHAHGKIVYLLVETSRDTATHSQSLLTPRVIRDMGTQKNELSDGAM